jgi:hypothetical protein
MQADKRDPASTKGIEMHRLIVCALIVLFAGTAHADAAFQFTLPGLQAPEDSKVDGVRLSVLYGKTQSLNGLDFGFFSYSEAGRLSGAAFVFGLHLLSGDMDGGLAWSLVNIHSGNDRGLNAAFVNKVNNVESGVDVAFVNVADGKTLVDIGALNLSDSSKVQVGIINVTEKLEGIQIGFINVADNGFLKVFPFFNFPKQ